MHPEDAGEVEGMRTQTLSAPCGCAECRQAGVSTLPQVVNEKTGEALHGYSLKRWHAARDQFLADYKRASDPAAAKTARPKQLSRFGK